MSSNCDSDGVPVDQDGHRMEDFVSHTAPFAIRTDVFQEVFSGYGKDVEGSHLEARAMSDVKPSSSGGIALENVVIVEDGYSSDENQPFVENDMSNMSATVQAILRTNKQEREALLSTKAKLSDVLCFLRKKGFSEAQIYEDFARDGFTRSTPTRDEFGLPEIGSLKTDKTKTVSTADKLVENMPHTPSGVKDNSPVAQDPYKDKMKEKLGDSPPVNDVRVSGDSKSLKPSWSTVVKNNVVDEVLSFDYCPMAPGASKVESSPDVVQEGLTPAVGNMDVASKTSAATGKSIAAEVKTVEVTDEVWTTVGSKKLKGTEGTSSVSSQQVPSQATVSANQMPIYSALAKSLSKGQQKKARKAAGRGSPKTK
ncbi:hypothetical protein ACET3Z_000740 [Daucus carota]